MAYPGENEHVEYLRYVEEMANQGQKPLLKDQWRQQRQQTPQPTQPTAPQVSPEAMSMVTNALMRRRM